VISNARIVNKQKVLPKIAGLLPHFHSAAAYPQRYRLLHLVATGISIFQRTGIP
jgi:hypothetical protein